LDGSRFLPPQAYDAPPDAFPPPGTRPEPERFQSTMPPMPAIGTPGGFGVTMLRLADMVRRYGQMSRQNRGY
jgi:hypothetical protein